MATTYEKMRALADELRGQAVEDSSGAWSEMVELVQIAAGLGIDVFEWIIPSDPADADTFVDQLLALFLRVRGDDLPPFDPNLYGDAIATEDVAGDTVTVDVIVSGVMTPVPADTREALGAIVGRALERSHSVGPADRWELRDVDGVLLDLAALVSTAVHAGRGPLFLNPRVGVAA